MARTLIPYTEQEDNTIISFIKNKNFKNLREAFEALAEQLPNRTVCSINQRYYSTLKFKEEMFYLANESGALINTKYVPRNKVADFKPFQVIVRQIMDLSPEDRKKVLDFFEVK